MLTFKVIRVGIEMVLVLFFFLVSAARNEMESDLSSFVNSITIFVKPYFVKKNKKRHAQPHSPYHNTVALIIYLCSR